MKKFIIALSLIALSPISAAFADGERGFLTDFINKVNDGFVKDYKAGQPMDVINAKKAELLKEFVNVVAALENPTELESSRIEQIQVVLETLS